MGLSKEERRKNRVIEQMTRFFDSPHEERRFVLQEFTSSQIIQIMRFCAKNPRAVEVLIRFIDRRSNILKGIKPEDVDAVKGFFECKETLNE